jgi:hypothetical protein
MTDVIEDQLFWLLTTHRFFSILAKMGAQVAHRAGRPGSKGGG